MGIKLPLAFIIYEKILIKLSSEIDKKIAKIKILIFKFGNYCIISISENKMTQKIYVTKYRNRNDLLDKNSGDFYTQIEFFTP